MRSDPPRWHMETRCGQGEGALLRKLQNEHTEATYFHFPPLFYSRFLRLFLFHH